MPKIPREVRLLSGIFLAVQFIACASNPVTAPFEGPLILGQGFYQAWLEHDCEHMRCTKEGSCHTVECVQVSRKGTDTYIPEDELTENEKLDWLASRRKPASQR